jgi:gamma-glutamylcyclotransferase (GGCT)/AIG2-like uncharacterized protein YtfP
MPDYLFVYGTLRRQSPHPMAKYLAERAKYVGEGTVVGRLYNFGRYPGMVESANASDLVIGDVYLLTNGEETIRELDRYENAESPHPAFFERGQTDVILTDGRSIAALVYWFRGEVNVQRIFSGDYFGKE